MARKNISATIEEGLMKRLDELARQSERNRSWLISKAIESYLDELEDLDIARSRIDDDRLSPRALRKEIDV